MLEDIKSQYILRIIIFRLREKRKLKLVKYNKNLQIKLDIKLLNYKIFSGKSITFYDNNKKGNIYDEYKNKLLFEGDVLNGQKNGKGKEYYDNGKIIYEGEFLNGYRNCKGKEYYKNGKLKIEGEYLNGKMHNGKIHYLKNNIIELKNGEGIIKECNDYCSNIIYDGEYLNGVRHGKGKEYVDNGKLKENI